MIGKGVDPLALRYLFLTSHYRDKLNFTWESLKAAQKALNNLREKIRLWEQPNLPDKAIWQKFMAAASNDLNIPQALAVLHEMVGSDTPTASMSATILEMDKILGLGLDEYVGKIIEIPNEVQKLINLREQVRKSGDFKKSDDLRHQIKKLGYEIEDTPKGVRVKKI